MRVLITGGSGFLAGRLLRLMDLSAEHTVRLVTRGPAQPGRDIRAVDWQSESSLLQACQDMDCVIHLAGMDAQACAQNPVAALEFNGVSTARLLKAAMQAGVRRFLYMSSAHVYGAALRGVVDESTCPQPRHPYATSHRAAEDVVRAAHEASAIEGVVMRLSNGFGYPANASPGCWKVIVNEFCLSAVQQRAIVMRSNGTQRRDFAPAGEVCRALLHLMNVPAPALGNGVFNIGSGQLRSLREVCEQVVDQVNARLGFRPAVSLGTNTDSVGSELQAYAIDRLLKTNFVPDSLAFEKEIADLIDVCAARHP